METNQAHHINQARNIERIRRQQGPTAPVGTDRAQGPSFRQVLDEQLASAEGTIKFSAHAQQRIEHRGIPFGPNDVSNLINAVDRAAEKGSKESLVLMDDKAFVVSVPNKTVITAVDRGGMKENVFTNIDSTVLI